MPIDDSLSLELKYRPKKLDDIIGQSVVVRAFKNALKYKTLHPAYILEGNLGSGKCIAGDSIVLLENKTDKIENIVKTRENKNFFPLEERVISETGIGKACWGYFERKCRTIKITTNEGYSIEGTYDHPIRIIDKDGAIKWRTLQNIREGDFVCIFRDLIQDSKNHIDIDFSFDIDKYLDERFGDGESVICSVCGNKYGNLSTHIQTHGISNDSYKKNFGTSTIISPVLRKHNALRNIKSCVKIPKKMDHDLSKLLGYLVSEGSIIDGLIAFHNSDESLIEEFSNLVRTVFKVEPRIKKDSRNNVKSVLIHHLLCRKFIESIIGCTKSGNKFVPDIVLKSSNSIVKEFLKAYFEGDGYSSGSYIGCSSKSFILMKQIQILLLRFGIISFVKKKYVKKLSYNNKDYTSWNLLISSENMKKFRDNIGFISNRKIEKMNEVCCHRKVNPNKDVIPYLARHINEFKKSLPVMNNGIIVLDGKRIGIAPRWNSSFGNKKYNATYGSLRSALEYFNEWINILNRREGSTRQDLIAKIRHVADNIKDIIAKNYFYSRVARIEENISDVYDISKEGDDKSFISNGFINHNTTVARIIAATENCEKKGPDPCGVCSNCKEILNGESQEVQEKNAASERGIDDIRELEKDLYLSPIKCRIRYIILDESHRLTPQASDAALKIIEEPPPFVRFFLLTTESQSITPTIHSRCVVWKFNKVNWTEMVPLLGKICKNENISYEESSLPLISKYAQGSVRDCIKNLQTVLNYSGKEAITSDLVREALGIVNEQLYFDLIDGIINCDALKCYKTIEQILRDGKEVTMVINDLYEHLNNLLLIKTCKNDTSFLNMEDSELKKYSYQSSLVKGDMILIMLNLINSVSFGIKYSLNPQVLFNKFSIEAILSQKKLNK